MPSSDRQSARLGVSLMVMRWSSRSRHERMFSPTTASSGSTSKPPWSSAMPSSRDEHSMPKLSMPRTLACLMSMPGKRAPTTAQGTFNPAATFGAPQTICKTSPCPASTEQRLSLSASGCFSTVNTCATYTPENSGATVLTSSTSNPAMVST